MMSSVSLCVSACLRVSQAGRGQVGVLVPETSVQGDPPALSVVGQQGVQSVVLLQTGPRRHQVTETKTQVVSEHGLGVGGQGSGVGGQGSDPWPTWSPLWPQT